MLQNRLTPELIAGYTAKGYWSDVTAGERLDRMVARFSQKTAIVDARRRTTYAEFGNLVDRLALGLDRLGIKRGDRITAQLPNWIETQAAYFAAAKIGAVLCPVVPHYRASEVRYILGKSESIAFMLPDTYAGFDYLNMLEQIRPDVPSLQHVIVLGQEKPQGAVSFHDLIDGVGEDGQLTPAEKARLSSLRPDANDPVVLMFTSGTEAAPKAPIWTHNTAHSVVAYNSSWCYTDKDVLLSLAPICHAFGMIVGCQVILAEMGASVVWMDAFDPEEAMRLVERERATVVLGVPAHLMSIVNHPNLKKYDLSSIRFFNTGGAAMPAEGIKRIKAEVGCGFITQWGASESVGGPVTRPDDPPELAATTIGRAAGPAVEIAIFDESRQNILPAGQPGEMAIRGPFVHAGYFKDPDLTQRAFHPDGWFFTGDSVVMDDRGYISFVSRIKDIINRGGEKISPIEIEEHLYAHPKVLSAVMIGMPDPRLGERNCVYVIARPGETITLDEITRFLQERGLAKVKLPERLELVDSFPMSPTGKVRKDILRQWVAEKLKQGV